ncbi:MAG: AmmeMemoRadiSam system protein A [Ignavibacteriae bacterium]|nr:AmmeMemoRadiSam system protein A [Ignavibacteriota bacterium]
MLSDSDKKLLLSTARKAIEAAVNNKPLPPLKNIPEHLKSPQGAFVTLKKNHELRGCIGYIESEEPLINTVQEVAMKSALNDPRFNPVEPEEVRSLELEISVLSPVRQIHNINEIEVGKHGLIIESGRARGLLLPQVPIEYGWDREIFLNQTARKAGLPMNAWKQPGTKISIFSAEVFSENDFRKREV